MKHYYVKIQSSFLDFDCILILFLFYSFSLSNEDASSVLPWLNLGFNRVSKIDNGDVVLG